MAVGLDMIPHLERQAAHMALKSYVVAVAYHLIKLTGSSDVDVMGVPFT